MPSRKQKIDKFSIDQARPQAKDLIIWDTDLPGFGLKVTPTGTKVYFVYYRTKSGQQRKPSIGRADRVSLIQARATAKTWLAQATLGGDISADRQTTRRAPTVSELGARYLTEYAEAYKKPSSIKTDRALIKNHVEPLIGRAKVTDLTRADLEAVKVAVAQGKTARTLPAKARGRRKIRGGRGIANRVIALLSKMLSCGQSWGLIEINPARGIQKYREYRRDRFLDADEIFRLLKTLDHVDQQGLESPFATAAIRLLLFSGLRLSEVTGLIWDQVDFQANQLRLDDSKTGARRVPINSELRAVLVSLPKGRPNHQVIQSAKPGAKISLTKPWYRVRALAGIDKTANLHCLRHTFASWSVMGGLSLAQVGALLGHKSAQTTLRYADHRQDAVADYSQQTASLIAELGKSPVKSSSPGLDFAEILPNPPQIPSRSGLTH